jgi:hypothetical protein
MRRAASAPRRARSWPSLERLLGGVADFVRIRLVGNVASLIRWFLAPSVTLVR